MVFYALHHKKFDQERTDVLERACKKLGIKFAALDPDDFDFAKPFALKKGDLLYRVGRGRVLKHFESLLLKNGVVSFYRNTMVKANDPFILLKEGISVPKTILCISNDRKKLDKYVKDLGGFPVVVKVLGGSRGMGVMLVDSLQSLYSLIDHSLEEFKLVVLRKYIVTNKSARLIVLGDKVLASNEYILTNKDFRTNAVEKPVVKPMKYSKEVEKLAIDAVYASALEFGGVDIIFDKKGKAYVTEVNFPCNFLRTQSTTKTDIALEMVKYLVDKAKS